jgi:pimeloyl-ACP methyl ester carboxylesterase
MDLYGDPAATPVVLLHGIPGWRGSWRAVARLLASRAYVVALDLAGFGESSTPEPALHAAGQADLVVALMKELGLRSVHLAGFDFGGLTAILACAKAPELVASLTLVATNVLADTPIPRPLQVVRAPFIGSLVSRILFGRVGLSMMWLAAVRRRDRLPFADYRRMLRFSNGITSTRRIFRASLCDLPGLYGPVQQTLASIRVPCAVLWGDRDPFFPVAVGERTAASIPGARFITLTGCGHFLPAEDPHAVAETLARAIATTPRIAYAPVSP